MKPVHVIRRFGPPVAAFLLAAFGVALITGGGGTSGDASVQASDAIPTVVAAGPIPAGTPTADLGGLVEVRSLPGAARAAGAVSSVDELPDGVVAGGLVAGQQVLASSVATGIDAELGGDLVALSATLDAQQWAGPLAVTGDRVDVWAIGDGEAQPIAAGVVVIDAPDPASVGPNDATVLVLGVPREATGRVVSAIAGAGIWLVTA